MIKYDRLLFNDYDPSRRIPTNHFMNNSLFIALSVQQYDMLIEEGDVMDFEKQAMVYKTWHFPNFYNAC